MDGTGGGAAGTAGSALRYSVLYYKRTNKVHKNRGVSRLDGVLTVFPPPSCKCTLVSGEDDDDPDDGEPSDDEDAGRGNSKKKKFQDMRRRMAGGAHRPGSGAVWSGTNPDLSRRAHGTGGVGADDRLALCGQWECEVVSVLGGGGAAKCAGRGGPGRASGGIQNNGRAMPATKRPGLPGPRGAMGALRKNAAGPIQRRQPLASRGRVGVGGVKRSLPPGGGSGAAARRPPPQPAASRKMKMSSNGEWSLERDGESSDDGEEEGRRAPQTAASRVPASLLRRKPSLPGGNGRRPPRPAGVAPPSSRPAAPPGGGGGGGGGDFPGALGDRINVPASVGRALRPHQREGVAFLWNCVTGSSPGLGEALAGAAGGSSDPLDGDDDDDSGGGKPPAAFRGEVPRGCCLADEMGLGKTLMTIATVYAYHRRQRDRRFIVVCPSSLVTNWAKEFDKWLGRASQPRRVVVRSGDETGLSALRSFVPLKPNVAEVLILSYELFRLHAKIVSRAGKVGLLVVDEGHRLKNTAGSQILTALESVRADARILITGTPIQNNLSEFWNVANFAVPGVLGSLSDFRRLYERPMARANQKNASGAERERGRRQSRALEAVTSTFVLRRLQRDVLRTLLPPRSEALLFCRPTPRQRELYLDVAGRASRSIGGVPGGIGDGGGGGDNPLALLTEVRKLCTHPALLGGDGDAGRRPRAVDAALSGKLAVLGNLLDSIRREEPTDKVVIVSNFTSALTIIENSVLREKNLSFVRLDGSTDNKSRGPLVDSFNSGSVDRSFAFLLSSKAGGCGLNLIGANRLIMVDSDFNPAIDHQAMARVYRQGQTKPCFVYRMFTTGTVEEIIYQRQLQKGNLARLANDGGNGKGGGGSGSASFTRDELRDCFALKTDCKSDTKDKVGKKWPTYNGATSLRDLGCCDEPLLALCEHASLTFVHLVEEDEADTSGSCHERKSTGDDSDFDESESSEEEAEWDG